jgi:lysophospholipase L1-like esterase
VSRFRLPLAVLLLTLPVLSAGAAAAQTGYIAFGDSITFGVGDDPLRTDKGYPARLQALLQGSGINAVVENRGIGGEATPEGLARIDGVLAESALTGDVLVLMEGTNDISRGFSVESIRFNLNEMARRAEARGLSVVHATTIPRLPNARFDSQNVTNTRLNQNIRDMAGRRERKLADPFEVFSTTPDLFTRYYYQGNDDPVGHPNAAGYDLLAQVFFDVIRGVDRVPPVAGLVSPEHGASNVSPSAPVSVEVWDFGLGIDLSATTLVVNGVVTGIVPTGDARHATLTYQPATPLAGVVSVGLRSRDLAAPANTVDRQIARFTIAGTQVLKGDLDQDGRVDGADLLRFARRFGSRRTDPLYSDLADLNADDVIDGQDLAILASNFGKSSF